MAYAYLELADFLLMAEAVLGVPAETLARSDRVVALAESALAAPAASFAGEDFYPDLIEKTAVLCSHLVRNHPLPDGNKRTAYLCLIEFIERNGYGWLQPADEAEESEVVVTMVGLAAGQLSEAEFAEWIHAGVTSGCVLPTYAASSRCVSRTTSFPSMSLASSVSACARRVFIG